MFLRPIAAENQPWRLWSCPGYVVFSESWCFWCCFFKSDIRNYLRNFLNAEIEVLTWLWGRWAAPWDLGVRETLRFAHDATRTSSSRLRLVDSWSFPKITQQAKLTVWSFLQKPVDRLGPLLDSETLLNRVILQLLGKCCSIIWNIRESHLVCTVKPAWLLPAHLNGIHFRVVWIGEHKNVSEENNHCCRTRSLAKLDWG